ncbi:hypothetical protein CLF_109489 [Clonorchis sinensis]|uniref:Uncharacterized protein n=1 Tax=Clonorchis sinensis TaxID=79923 RepID=G7YJE7_CLOSI|nr:hypothetical protein CLF_109489 [Clonorchis sinensis]
MLTGEKFGVVEFFQFISSQSKALFKYDQLRIKSQFLGGERRISERVERDAAKSIIYIVKLVNICRKCKCTKPRAIGHRSGYCRLPKPGQGKSRDRGRVRTADLPVLAAFRQTYVTEIHPAVHESFSETVMFGNVRLQLHQLTTSTKFDQQTNTAISAQLHLGQRDARRLCVASAKQPSFSSSKTACLVVRPSKQTTTVPRMSWLECWSTGLTKGPRLAQIWPPTAKYVTYSYTLDRVNEAGKYKNQTLYLGSVIARIGRKADVLRHQKGRQLRVYKFIQITRAVIRQNEHRRSPAFMHSEVPKEQALKDDPYIFQLEAKVREKLALPPIRLTPSEARKSEDEFTASDLKLSNDLQFNERRRSSAREFAECLLRRKFTHLIFIIQVMFDDDFVLFICGEIVFHNVPRELHAEFFLLLHQAPSNSQLIIYQESYLTVAISSGSSTIIRTRFINAFGHPDKTLVTYESVDIRQDEDFL